jgi:hypothetical protein
MLHDGARSHVENLCEPHRFVGAENFSDKAQSRNPDLCGANEHPTGRHATVDQAAQ